MKKIKNIIGSILIGLSRIIGFLRIVLLFGLIIGIVMGILVITMVCLFDLLGYLNPNENVLGYVLFKKPIWDIVVAVIGLATMGLGVQKMFEEDKSFNENMNKNKIKS